MNVRSQMGWAWIIVFVPATAIVLTLCAEPIVEGGSPLYRIAVEESIAGLKGGRADPGGAAGEVCPQCGQVHAPAAPASTNHVHAAPPVAAAPGEPCPDCGQIHASAGAPAGTNHVHGASAPPDGANAGDYYYCERCRQYHRRQPAVALPH